MASWAARIPQVRNHLHMTPGQLGVVLLCIAIGSLVSLPLSGLIVARFGEARTVAAMALLECFGLVVAASVTSWASCRCASGWCCSGWATAAGTSR